MSIVRMKGMNEAQALAAFPLSLIGEASKWYYGLDDTQISSWESLMKLFKDQYNYNTTLDTTLHDLKMTIQKSGETFFEFLARWRKKVIKMVNSLQKGIKSIWS